MTTRACVLFLLSISAWAQTKWDNSLKTWFIDGTCLEIHTESSGTNSPRSNSGSIIVGAGNQVHRAVLDTKGKMIFAYDIEAGKSPVGTYFVRIKPVDQEKIRQESWFPTDRVTAGPIPTLAGVREFPPLHVADEVQVDILFHPATGEKIYDVLRVSAEPRPESKPAALRGNQFSFNGVRIAIDGKTIQEMRNSWIIGESVRIYLPGRGVFYLTMKPPANYPFQASGWADHNVLRFHADTELVEITGKSNVLQKSDYGTIWVYRDANDQTATEATALYTKLLINAQAMRSVYKPEHPDMKALEKKILVQKMLVEALEKKKAEAAYVDIQMADEVEMLMPTRTRNDE